MRTLHTLISHLTLTGAAALGLVLPMAAAAAEPGGPKEPDGASSSWGLGLGVISAQKPYTGMDRETKVLPMISYENSWLRVQGLGAEVKLPRMAISETQNLDFRLLARYDGSGYEADDAPILAGMAERKGEFLAGAKVTWNTDIASLGAEWVADASGHSKGQRFSLSLSKNWRLGSQWMVSPRLGATWLDKKYVDYYFGVRSNEATTGRAAYLGQSTVNTEVGVRTAYMFDRHHSLFLDLGVTSLGKEIKDSPLVDRSTENRVFMGYLYRF